VGDIEPPTPRQLPAWIEEKWNTLDSSIVGPQTEKKDDENKHPNGEATSGAESDYSVREPANNSRPGTLDWRSELNELEQARKDLVEGRTAPHILDTNSVGKEEAPKVSRVQQTKRVRQLSKPKSVRKQKQNYVEYGFGGKEPPHGHEPGPPKRKSKQSVSVSAGSNVGANAAGLALKARMLQRMQQLRGGPGADGAPPTPAAEEEVKEEVPAVSERLLMLAAPKVKSDRCPLTASTPRPAWGAGKGAYGDVHILGGGKITPKAPLNESAPSKEGQHRSHSGSCIVNTSTRQHRTPRRSRNGGNHQKTPGGSSNRRRSRAGQPKPPEQRRPEGQSDEDKPDPQAQEIHTLSERVNKLYTWQV
jgi:hypothetical protein